MSINSISCYYANKSVCFLVYLLNNKPPKEDFMISKTKLNIILGTTIALSTALIASASLTDFQNPLLATTTTKSMTINGSSGVYTQFDVISYTGNYENDANYALKTFESHTFKTAIIYNSTFYGTYTVGGDYIFKTMYPSSGSACGILNIGLSNFTSISLTVATDVANETIDYASVTFYDSTWTHYETIGVDKFVGSHTLTPTKLDENGNSYVPRWASIWIGKNLGSPTSSNFIALTSITFNWEC